MMYFGFVFPYMRRTQNILELVTEIVILFSTYFMMIYSDFVPDLEARYLMGWINISMIIAVILVALLSIFMVQSYGFYRLIRRKIFQQKRAKKEAYLDRSQVSSKALIEEECKTISTCPSGHELTQITLLRDGSPTCNSC